ncbi:MAG: hypothetical protein JW904_07155 [Spirochaetales bacterium]|nr:hypothetical protein [Spirochaetales bacterium]
MKKSVLLFIVVIFLGSCSTLPRQNVDVLEKHFNGVVFREYGKQENPITREVYFYKSVLFAVGKEKDIASAVNGTVIDRIDNLSSNEKIYDVYMGTGTCLAIESVKGYVVLYGGITTTLEKGDAVTTKSIIGKTGPNPEPYTFNFAVLVEGEAVDPFSITYDLQYFFGDIF